MTRPPRPPRTDLFDERALQHDPGALRRIVEELQAHRAMLLQPGRGRGRRRR